MLSVALKTPQAGRWWTLVHLLLRSQGMFVYLVLVLQELERSGSVAVLHGLPRGIEAYLQDCFGRNVESEWSTAKPIVQVLLAAERPCALKQVFNILRMLQPSLQWDKFAGVFNMLEAYLVKSHGSLLYPPLLSVRAQRTPLHV